MSLHGNDVCLVEVKDYNLYDDEASDHAFSRSEKHSSGGKTMEAEKRMRREIANSNERRRMQSINAGFQALRTLLPRHEGEKLSKAAILQQTAEYIYSLEQEKTRLLSQNCQLKRLLNQHEGGEMPLKKRKADIYSSVPTIIPDSTDDNSVITRSPEPISVVTAPPKKDVECEVRSALERERRLRRSAEQRLQGLEAQLFAARDQYEPSESDSKQTKSDDEMPLSPEPPLLEAAIKAEPRVKVEVLPDAPDAASLYIASTSRQNLETIVEAIRHLEGDHLFREETSEAPLALTTKERAPPPPPPPRPGVIVVKHS